MKKSLLFLAIVLLIANQTIAQAQSIPYQAVARDNSGNLIVNQLLNLRFTIHNLTAGGSTVYQETDTATTNSLGLFTVPLGIGTVTSGTFNGISWGSGSKFMQVELFNGGSWNTMGTSQMMSVPYALYAGNAASVPSGNLTESDALNVLSISNGTNSVLGTGTTIGVAGNSVNQAGVVTAPTSSNNYRVWATDVNGNPGWRYVVGVAGTGLTSTDITVGGVASGAASVLEPTTLTINKGNLTESDALNVLSIGNGSNSVLGTGTSIGVATNAVNQAGVVAAPTATTAWRVWATDASGNPAWRYDQNVSGAPLTSSDIIVTNGSEAVLGPVTLTINKGNLTDAGTDGITVTNGTGAVIGTSGTSIAQQKASATTNGYLSSADWNTFNSKLTASLASTYIYVGSSGGVATAVPVSGDATISNAGAITLKNTGTAGTYGSASTVPVFTTDAQGRVTAVTNTAITATTNANLTGPITSVGNATSITANAVTLGDLSTLAANSVIGNSTGSTATPTAVPMLTTATASSVAMRDANADITANNFIVALSVTTSSGGTTTLTTASAHNQVFQGTNTQTVILPPANTLVLGQSFYISNRNTGTGNNLTVENNAGTSLQVLIPYSQAVFTVIGTGSAAGTWDVAYWLAYGAAVTSVNASGGTSGLSFTGGPITSTGTLTLGGTLGVANGGTGAATLTGGGILLGNGTGALSTSAAPTTSGQYLRSTGAGTWAVNTVQASDIPVLNQNTTGNAATVTTDANLTGPITSVGNATSVASQTGTGSTFVMQASPTLTTPNIGAATGTSIALSGNSTANNHISGFTTTATAAGTTTLTAASMYTQDFTGTTTQTVVLPAATTLAVGQAFFVTNRSTGNVTVEANGGATVQVVAAASQALFTLVTNGTAAGTWDVSYNSATTTLAGDVTGPSTATNVSALQGTPISATAPTTRQLLAYSGTTTQWAPVTLSGDISLTLATGTTAIGANKVTYAKMQTETNATILGNNSGALASPSEIGLGTGLAFSGTSTLINSAPLSSLTVTGNSGAATLSAGALNIPTYTLAGLGGIGLTALSASAPLSYNNTSGAFTISQATSSANGYLSSTDWNTFNGKQNALTAGNLSDAGTDGISITSGTGAVIGSGTSIAQAKASGTQNGYLSSTDWITFNNKQSALTLGNVTSSDLTITGGSGAVVGSGTSLTINKGTLAPGSSGVVTVTNGSNSVLGTGTTVDVTQATTSTNGYLSSTDWNTFNGKQATLAYAAPANKVGLSAAAAGSASTILRSDATFTIDQTIAPTWTGLHTFTGGITETGTASFNGGTSSSTTTIGNTSSGGAVSINASGANNITHTLGTGSAVFASTTANSDAIAILPATGGASSFTGTLSSLVLTAAHTWSLPDVTGTIAVTTVPTITNAVNKPAWSVNGDLLMPLASSATTITAGLLSYTDWNTFNNKVAATTSKANYIPYYSSVGPPAALSYDAGGLQDDGSGDLSIGAAGSSASALYIYASGATKTSTLHAATDGTTAGDAAILAGGVTGVSTSLAYTGAVSVPASGNDLLGNAVTSPGIYSVNTAAGTSAFFAYSTVNTPAIDINNAAGNAGTFVSAGASSSAIVGANVTASSATNTGNGVYGATIAGAGAGVFGYNAYAGGTAASAAGVVASTAGATATAGTPVIALYAATINANTANFDAVYGKGNSVFTGSKSALVNTSKGGTLLYCTESPEVWFEDFGNGQLINGIAHVELDALFLETVTINDQHPMEVFIQLEGACDGGVYVTKNASSFDVHQQGNNLSNAKFSYRIVGKRKGYEDKRLEPHAFVEAPAVPVSQSR